MSASPQPTLVRPPIGLLALAAFVILACLLLALAGTFAANAIGYVGAAFVGLGCVVVYWRVDTRRKADVYYQPNRSWGALAKILAVSALVVASINTWAIATYLSK